MKLLLFSDLHADATAARRLVELAADVDVLVGAGDFGNMRHQVQNCIRELRMVDKPAVLVPGNAESAEELWEACEIWPTAHVLHGSGVSIGGVPFFGIGGAVPVTPFGEWSYDFTEEQALELLRECPTEGVLVCHSPPFGAVDVSSAGRRLGSSAIRAVVERVRPKLVVCGHIHACGGKREDIGVTPVINAGPDGVIWDIG